MIGFLWFHTLFFPAMVFLGGLVSALWLIGKVVDAVERIGSRIARSWHSDISKHSNNFD